MPEIKIELKNIKENMLLKIKNTCEKSLENIL